MFMWYVNEGFSPKAMLNANTRITEMVNFFCYQLFWFCEMHFYYPFLLVKLTHSHFKQYFWKKRKNYIFTFKWMCVCSMIKVSIKKWIIITHNMYQNQIYKMDMQSNIFYSKYNHNNSCENANANEFITKFIYDWNLEVWMRTCFVIFIFIRIMHDNSIKINC